VIGFGIGILVLTGAYWWALTALVVDYYWSR